MALPRSAGLLLVPLVIFSLFIQPATAQTDRIVLNATVVTDSKRPLPPLEAGDFTIVADKEPLKLVSFNHGNAPVSVGILVDASGSASRPSKKVMQYVAAGIDRLLQVGNPQNEYFVAAFDSKPGLVHDWTNDAQSIRNKLVPLELKGQSALYDGLFESVEHVKKGKHNKKAIVVVSDGMDNNSQKTFNEVRDLLRESDVLLYSVFVMNEEMAGSSLAQEGMGVMSDLSKVSGGQALLVERSPNEKTVGELFELIGTEIRSQYELVIESPAATGARKLRKIKITAAYTDANGKRKELKVRTREGVYR